MKGGSRPHVSGALLDEKLRRNFVVILVLASLGVGLQVGECYWMWAHGESDAVCELLKMLSSFFTLWLVGFLFLYYVRTFEQQKRTNALLPEDTMASSGLFFSARTWSFLPEALLCFIHAPPFVCFELVVRYYDVHRGSHLTTTMNTDELGAVAMMLARSVLLVRWAPYLAGVWTQSARAYANLNQLNLSLLLAVRMAYIRAPVKLLGSISTLLLLMLGFALQVAERRASPDLEAYSNCLWLAFSSMTTIGYGDVYPQTALGRLASGIAFLWGAIFAALLVNTMWRATELSENELRVNKMVAHMQMRTRIKQVAAYYIQAAWATYLERLQRSQSSLASAALLGAEPLHADPKCCRAMRRFRSLRKRLSKPDNVLHLTFKEVLDTRSRLELRMRDIEEKLEEMDAKFEHNIAAMNELLQKNLKYLKHLS